MSPDQPSSSSPSLSPDQLALERAEQALARSEARWRAVIDSTVDAMIVIDARGTIEVFNRAAERMFGYAEEETLGRNVSLIMPEPYRSEHDGYIDNYRRTGEQRIIGIGREVIGRRRDGTTFPVHLSVGEMRTDGESHFTGILHDLTERARLEEQVREQTALVRLGEMAAVIAHEVKNPLAAVRGAIQVIGGRLPSGNRDLPIIKEIVARIDTLNDLINDLLLFARTPKPKIAMVDLGILLRLTTGLLVEDPACAGVIFMVVGDTVRTEGDAELLKIVFQNLLINAAQAMQGQGTVTTSLSTEGTTVVITVADTGQGLPAEAREHLFRPFFTTKARGTGLGLATAKRLVELHSGSIRLDSTPGSGTTVTVRLPLPR